MLSECLFVRPSVRLSVFYTRKSRLIKWFKISKSALQHTIERRLLFRKANFAISNQGFNPNACVRGAPLCGQGVPLFKAFLVYLLFSAHLHP